MELQSSEGLRAANKLHERHIQWNRQKMKVKLAAQTLSSSVADAIAFCDETLHLPKFQNSSATVNFIRIIDHLFDILNSRNPLAKGYKAPMRLQNEEVWRPFLLHAVQHLMGLKLANGQLICNSLRKTGVIGFVASAQSAIRLFDNLIKEESLLKYLLTYKFSQDHLELFFAVIRSRGGNNNNPSPLQLRATWKRLLTHNHVKDVATGNCEPTNACKLLTINGCIEQMQRKLGVDLDSLSRSRQNNPDEETKSVCVDHDYMPSMTSLSKFVDNVIVYIAGFVVRSLQSELHCDICIGSLRYVRQDDVCQSDFGLIETKDRGGLISPSNDVIAVCKSAELSIRKIIGPSQKPAIKNNVTVRIENVLSNFIGTNIFMSLAEHGLETTPLNNHLVNLIRSIASKYIKIRLHHQCKTYTRLVQGENCRSVCNKTVVFKGQ